VNKLSRVVLLVPLFLALLVCSCSTVDQTKKKDSEYIYHRVMAGETLSSIARWYTGLESMWHEIAEDNPKLSPSSLRLGDIVKVSVSLATVHKEQPPYSTKPHKATNKTNRGPGVEESNSSAVPAPEEVFGPR
jgi:hypothetical protein